MAWFNNHYRCPGCGARWEDQWSCTCDDDCPECGERHLSPRKSDDLSVTVDQEHRDSGIVWCVLKSSDEAEDDPDYRTVAICNSRRTAEMVANCVRAA